MPFKQQQLDRHNPHSMAWTHQTSQNTSLFVSFADNMYRKVLWDGHWELKWEPLTRGMEHRTVCSWASVPLNIEDRLRVDAANISRFKWSWQGKPLGVNHMTCGAWTLSSHSETLSSKHGGIMQREFRTWISFLLNFCWIGTNMIQFFSCCPPEYTVLRLYQMEKEEG